MLRFILSLAFLLGLGGPVLAQVAGTITHLSGTLSAKRADGSTKLLGVRSEVMAGDTLTTESETYARLKFQDGAEIVLRPNSQFRVDKYAYEEAKSESDSMVVSLLKGGMRAVTGLLGKRNPGKVNVNTAVATIGIRGTHFGLLFCNGDCANLPTVSGQSPANGLHIDVASGAVSVTNSGNPQGLTLQAGQFGYVQNASVPPQLVPPNQGIRVTMPQTIANNNTGGRSLGGSGSGAGSCSISSQ